MKSGDRKDVLSVGGFQSRASINTMFSNFSERVLEGVLPNPERQSQLDERRVCRVSVLDGSLTRRQPGDVAGSVKLSGNLDADKVKLLHDKVMTSISVRGRGAKDGGVHAGGRDTRGKTAKKTSEFKTLPNEYKSLSMMRWRLRPMIQRLREDLEAFDADMLYRNRLEYSNYTFTFVRRKFTRKWGRRMVKAMRGESVVIKNFARNKDDAKRRTGALKLVLKGQRPALEE